MALALTAPTGSDYCHQYAPELAEMYANVETCPEELLLFFHHMPYNYVLKSGKTILQHIYDTHFEGAEDAARFYDEVVTLKPYLDPAVYARLEARFAHQKEHACHQHLLLPQDGHRRCPRPQNLRIIKKCAAAWNFHAAALFYPWQAIWRYSVGV